MRRECRLLPVCVCVCVYLCVFCVCRSLPLLLSPLTHTDVHDSASTCIDTHPFSFPHFSSSSDLCVCLYSLGAEQGARREMGLSSEPKNNLKICPSTVDSFKNANGLTPLLSSPAASLDRVVCVCSGGPNDRCDRFCLIVVLFRFFWSFL
jgi:hypothetical protein